MPEDEDRKVDSDDTMDVTGLDWIIREWKDQTKSETAREMFSERERLHELMQRLLDPARLTKIDEENVQEAIKNLWASRTWNNLDFRAGMVTKANSIEILRKSLHMLLYSDEPIAERFNKFLVGVSNMGPSSTAELLFWIHPERCWLANQQLERLEEAAVFDVSSRLPRGQKRDQGLRYLAHRPFIEALRERLETLGCRVGDFRDLDAFVWYAAKRVGIASEPCVFEEDHQFGKDFLAKVREHCPAERVEHRRLAEGRARDFLEKHLGTFTPDEFREFLKMVNEDFYGGSVHGNRFSPAFSAVWVDELLASLDAINEWSVQLWGATDSELTEVLGRFWSQKPVRGAGMSLPTMFLYLRSPDTFCIRMGILDRGLRRLFPNVRLPREPGKSYDVFNALSQRFRRQYDLAPQAMDVVLTLAAKWEKPPEDGAPGFSDATFQYLQDLRNNNNTDWMRQHRDEYARHVRDPLEILTGKVGKSLVEVKFNPILGDDLLETSPGAGRCLGRINRNSFGKGNPYYSYMWSAFYRKSVGKKADAQLYIFINTKHLRFGFGFGDRAEAIKKRFVERVVSVADELWNYVDSSSGFAGLQFADDSGDEPSPNVVNSSDDLVAWANQAAPSVHMLLKPGDPRLSLEKLTSLVDQVFQTVFPFFIVAAMEDDWESALEEYCEPDEPPERKYDFDWLVAQTHLDEPLLHDWVKLLEDRKQVILYGPPGTGKTYLARSLARHVAGSNEAEHVRLIQFHPSYCYEDFIEGIRPVQEEGALGFRLVPGVLREFCRTAAKNRKQPHVLIIDEFNRGNVAKVFGELMYLLEYRDQSIQLPRSKVMFSLPDNVYFIGTMNTADRSIALVDYALRRRFAFIEVTPSADVLMAWMEEQEIEDLDIIVGVFRELNERLESRFGKDLMVGHSYFMKKDLDETGLGALWIYSILPLVEEYFYGESKVADQFGIKAIGKAVRERLEQETENTGLGEGTQGGEDGSDLPS